jgi:DNA-binding response OmpR family regulator
MASRENTVRAGVMIVEPDVNIGNTLANWLEAHGYEAVLVRSVEAAIEELCDVRPRLVFVGSGHSGPTAQIEISEILRLIRTVCPGVPMLTGADWANEDVTQIEFRQRDHHVRIKPV